MRLYMSDIDNQADIIIYPILSFNIRVTKILVAQHVSPRTRKIVQIANEAAEARIVWVLEIQTYYEFCPRLFMKDSHKSDWQLV